MALSKTGRKRVLNAMSVAGFVMFLAGIYLFECGASYGAGRPDSNTGQTYEINNHALDAT